MIADQTPLPPTRASPTADPLSRIVTVSPALPVPVTIGVVTLVMPSLFEKPLSLPALKVSVGAGVEVTMLRVSRAEAGETLPARSVSVAVSVFRPAASGLVVTDQMPPLTMALPTLVLPSRSVTTSPLMPVPVMTGVVTLVTLSPWTPVSLSDDRVRARGAGGIVVSMVSVWVAALGAGLPAGSVALTETVLVPLVFSARWPLVGAALARSTLQPLLVAMVL